jgi:type VI secretion system VasD/TssJ family lipoprotein
MKKHINLWGIIFLCFFFVSCASKPPIAPPPEWRYEKEAIRLHLKSDPRLNLYEDSPHTLLFCIYQLTDPNAFNQQKEEKEGVAKLLECTRFDPSVATSKRMVIQPGQDTTLLLDRAENAKYVGVVAGYYHLQKDYATKLKQVPLQEEIKGGWFSKTKVVKPGILKLELYLGPQAIQEIKGR